MKNNIFEQFYKNFTFDKDVFNFGKASPKTVKSFFKLHIKNLLENLNKDISFLVSEELLQARKDRIPTSRITSLSNKIDDKIKEYENSI